MRNFTAKYTKIDSGYMGQLIEWPEVITESDTIENCRVLLRDCLNEMVQAYHQLNKEIPYGTTFYENITMDMENVGQT